MNPNDSWFWKKVKNWIRHLRKMGIIPALFVIFFSGCSVSIHLPGDDDDYKKVYQEMNSKAERITQAFEKMAVKP